MSDTALTPGPAVMTVVCERHGGGPIPRTLDGRPCLWCVAEERDVAIAKRDELEREVVRLTDVAAARNALIEDLEAARASAVATVEQVRSECRQLRAANQEWQTAALTAAAGAIKAGVRLAEVMTERDRLRAGLEMLAQLRSVSGSAQAAFRSNLRTIDAILAGADVTDLATVEAIAAGTWVAPGKGSPP